MIITYETDPAVIRTVTSHIERATSSLAQAGG
jgi:hypothetical protein